MKTVLQKKSISCNNKIVRRLTVKITEFANGGYGVGKVDGKTAFVRFALPDETVEAEVVKEKKGFIIAEAKEIKEPSTHRIEPKCPHYYHCGGCDLQHAEYSYQLALKKEVFLNTIKRLSNLEPENGTEIEPSVKQWSYRKRVQFKCRNGRWGFYKKSSNQFVEISECPVADGLINEYIKNNRCKAGEVEIDDYGNINSDEMILNLGLKHPLFYKKGAFTQVNREVNLKIIDDLKREVNALNPNNIVEFFCGIGNFTIPLALEGYNILAVEFDIKAVSSLKRNIGNFNLKNISVLRANLFEQFKIKGHFDLAILDPPREGAKNVAQKLLRKNINNIIYISCDPATLSRDMKILSKKYTLVKSKLYDMFPQTHHIESMNILKLNKE